MQPCGGRLFTRHKTDCADRRHAPSRFSFGFGLLRQCILPVQQAGAYRLGGGALMQIPIFPIKPEHYIGVLHFFGKAWRLELFRSEEHTSELQSLMRISYAVFCLKKKKNKP